MDLQNKQVSLFYKTSLKTSKSARKMDGIGKQALREPKLRQECMFLICAQFWIFRFYLFNLECLWSPWNYGGGAEKRRGSRIQGIGHILTGKLVRNTRAFYGLSRNGEKKMGQERGRVNGVNQPKLRINENTFENHYSDQYPAWMVNVFPRIYWLINEISQCLSYLAGKSYSSPKEQRLKLLLLLLVAQQN